MFQRALWNHLYDPPPHFSEGDAAKALARVLGDSLAVRVTMIALEKVLKHDSLSPHVQAYYDAYQSYISHHEIRAADHTRLETKRIVADERYKKDLASRQPADVVAINAGMALECYLAVGAINDQSADVFSAKALHGAFKLQNEHRLAFWASIIDASLALLDSSDSTNRV